MEHRTKDGDLMKLSEMSDQHLINTIRLIERKATEGIEVEVGGSGLFGGDIWFDVITIRGSAALKRMKYHEYMKEMERRKKA